MIGSYDSSVARWGTPDAPIELSGRAREFLTAEVGVATPAPMLGRANIAVRPSRLDDSARAALEAALGADGVSDSDDDRLAHAGGFSYLDLIDRRAGISPLPDAVVRPASHLQVAALLKAAAACDLAVIPFGGGTSVVGGVNPDRGPHGAIVAIAFDRMAELLDVDDINMTATVGPGITGPTLERLLAARGMTLGHFPQSWERATIGGYVATRSAGQASSGYGRCDDMVEALRVVTPRGDFVLGRAPGSAAGPDLRQLFIGSEGAFGVITEITLRVRRMPAERRYEGVMFPTYELGLAAFREIAARRTQPDVMRLADPQETHSTLTMGTDGAVAAALDGYLKLRHATGGALAIFGWEGTRTQVGSRRDETWRVLRAHKAVALGRRVGKSWEHARFAGPYLRDTLLDEGYLVETLETATGWRELPALRESVTAALRDSLADDGPGPFVMSHLSHVYETGGSLYVTVIARRDHEHSSAQWSTAKAAACDAIVAAGATITHHHAVGRYHAAWLEGEIGRSGIDLLRCVKTHLDPDGILAPGILVTDVRR